MNIAPLTVGILESSLDGHRGYYLRILLEAVVDLPINIKLLIPVNLMDRFKCDSKLVSVCAEPISIRSFYRSGVLSEEMDKFNALDGALKTYGIQHLYIPFGDGIAQWLGFRTFLTGWKRFREDVTAETLLFHCRFAYPQRGLVHRLRSAFDPWFLAKAKFGRLHFLDSRAFHVAAQSNRLGGISRWMPEYLESWDSMSKNEARRMLFGVQDAFRLANRPIISCPGLVEERKGSELLMNAFAALDSTWDGVLLLAGKHSEGLKALLSTRYRSRVENRTILSMDRHLSEAEFQACFHASDFICLPYKDHQSVSSVYLRAAVLGKPTLTSNMGWFSWAVPHYGHGEMVDVNSPDAFRESLLRFIKKPIREHRITERSEQILRENSPSAVKDAWTALLRSRISRSSL